MDAPLHRETLRVAFGDTDMSGWMYFPNVFRYVEVAEHAFLRARGIPIMGRDFGGWPRAHVDCDYRRPLMFGDEIEVRLAIERIGASSITWRFEIQRAGETCATGSVVTVSVDERGKPREIPAGIRALLVV